MWARIIEMIGACWLVLSQFIFQYPPQQTYFWINDLICGVLIALCALLSFSKKWERAHLCILLVAFWLVGCGFSTYPELASVAEQNSLLVGLVLMMLAIIPSHSHRSPRAWRKFYGE